MNKTKIEWVKNPDGTQGYTWNPITGCLNQVNGMCNGGNFPCYAYKLAHGRLKTRYSANKNIATVYAEGGEPYHKADKAIAEIEPFYPRFWPRKLSDPYSLRKPSGIFACDMSDLFGIGIPEVWTEQVMAVIKTAKEHRFYLLTKQPQNLIKWSPFPENCWVGVTVTTSSSTDLYIAEETLEQIKAKVRFLSIEPLLKWDNPAQYVIRRGGDVGWLNWLIIGACTGTEAEMSELVRKYPALTVMQYENKWTAQPRIEWVQEIVEAADKAGIPVFLKDNLRPILPLPQKIFCTEHPTGVRWLKKEFPKLE
jgi:protein gp37